MKASIVSKESLKFLFRDNKILNFRGLMFFGFPSKNSSYS